MLKTWRSCLAGVSSIVQATQTLASRVLNGASLPTFWRFFATFMQPLTSASRFVPHPPWYYGLYDQIFGTRDYRAEITQLARTVRVCEAVVEEVGSGTG